MISNGNGDFIFEAGTEVAVEAGSLVGCRLGAQTAQGVALRNQPVMRQRHSIPLLKDHHTHPSVYAAMGDCLDLREISTLEQAMEQIRVRGEGFQFVLGWTSSRYVFAPSDLEKLPPIFILSLSLHDFLMNTSGKNLLRETHPDIVAEVGNSDWIERNLPSILKMVVEVMGCDPGGLSRFYAGLKRRGVWYAEEMLLPGSGVIDSLTEAGLMGRTSCWADPAVFQELEPDQRELVFGIKLFADGALGARTAALEDPYKGGGGRGLLLRSDEELREQLADISGWQKPVAIHVIGGRAIGQVLDGLEKLASRGISFPRPRLEHCQFMTRRNAERAKELGTLLSMQPNFSVDSVIYRDRLNQEQQQNNNPFRMLIDEAGFEPGKDLILGSDGMPHGARFALQSSLFPPQPGQVLTLDEFVAGYGMPDLEFGSIEIEIDDTNLRVSLLNNPEQR